MTRAVASSRRPVCRAADRPGPRRCRLPRSVGLWMGWIASAALGGCAAPGLTSRVEAVHAAGEAGASTMRGDTPLAVQGHAAAA